MTPDERHKIYNAGFESGKKHAKPSKDTIIFMAKFEEKIKTIDGNMKCLKRKMEDVPTTNDIKLLFEESIKKTIKDCDKKYASKFIEQIVIWFLRFFALGVAGVIGKFLIDSIVK